MKSEKANKKACVSCMGVSIVYKHVRYDHWYKQSNEKHIACKSIFNVWHSFSIYAYGIVVGASCNVLLIRNQTLVWL